MVKFFITSYKGKWTGTDLYDSFESAKEAQKNNFFDDAMIGVVEVAPSVTKRLHNEI